MCHVFQALLASLQQIMEWIHVHQRNGAQGGGGGGAVVAHRTSRDDTRMASDRGWCGRHENSVGRRQATGQRWWAG
jgi:hypothetical protein